VLGRQKALTVRLSLSVRWCSTLAPKLLLLVVLFPCAMKLLTEPVKIRRGEVRRHFDGHRVKTRGGIWFLGNGALATVSVMISGLRGHHRLRESPRNISGVGTMPRCVLPSITRSESQVNRKTYGCARQKLRNVDRARDGTAKLAAAELDFRHRSNPWHRIRHCGEIRSRPAQPVVPSLGDRSHTTRVASELGRIPDVIKS